MTYKNWWVEYAGEDNECATQVLHEMTGREVCGWQWGEGGERSADDSEERVEEDTTGQSTALFLCWLSSV